MSTTERYRIGVIESDDRPSLEEVASAIDGEFRTRTTEEQDDGTVLDYREKGQNVYLHRTSEDEENPYDYVHFRYVANTKDSYPVLNEDGEIDEESVSPVVNPRVMYFENGQFAIESRNKVEEFWIPDYIGRVTGRELDRQEWRLYNIESNYLSEIYNSHDIISTIKVAKPERDISADSEIDELILELFEEVNSFTFSRGLGGGNLKSRSTINRCADVLDIKKIRMKNEGGNMEQVSGQSIEINYSTGEIESESTDARQQMESLAVQSRLRPKLELAAELYH
jgi:hypothetical protein